MNREIKFRAWDLDKKQFVSQYDTGDYSPIEWIDSKGEYRVNYLDLGCSCDPGCPCGGCYDIHVEAENTVLQQYIGLQDKNGQHVYEADIIKTWHPFSKFDYNADKQEEFCEGIWICEWKTPAFIFTQNDPRCIGTKTSLNKEFCEVIGNIYQNPELLKNEIIS